MNSYHESTKIVNYNNYKLGISNHKVVTEKNIGVNNLRFINMSDFHTIAKLSKSKLLAIKYFLEDNKGKINFIVVPGDIVSGKSLKNDGESIKKTFNEFSNIGGNIPIFIIPGNHEFGIVNDFIANDVYEVFKSLKTANVIPLINDHVSYNSLIELYGIVYGKEGYSLKNMIDDNSRYLLNHLQKTLPTIDSEKLNIALIHDCFASFYSKDIKTNNLSPKDFDIIVSGHGHGGCNSYHKLCNNKEYHKGYTDYFVTKNFDNSPIPSYGMYKLGDNSILIVTEGVSRFNGWLPQFFPTIPFVSNIEVSKIKKK